MEEDINKKGNNLLENIKCEFTPIYEEPRIGITKKEYKEYLELKTRNKELEQESKASKATINILTNKLEKVVEENGELKQEITVLQNTKDTCPSLNTSGVRCSLKESEE